MSSKADIPWWVYVIVIPGIYIFGDFIALINFPNFAQNVNTQVFGFIILVSIIIIVLFVEYFVKKIQRRCQRKTFEGMDYYQECVVQFSVSSDCYSDPGGSKGKQRFLKFFEAFRNIHFLVLEKRYTPRILTRFPDLNTEYKEKTKQGSSSITSTYDRIYLDYPSIEIWNKVNKEESEFKEKFMERFITEIVNSGKLIYIFTAELNAFATTGEINKISVINAKNKVDPSIIRKVIISTRSSLKQSGETYLGEFEIKFIFKDKVKSIYPNIKYILNVSKIIQNRLNQLFRLENNEKNGEKDSKHHLITNFALIYRKVKETKMELNKKEREKEEELLKSYSKVINAMVDKKFIRVEFQFSEQKPWNKWLKNPHTAITSIFSRHYM